MMKYDVCNHIIDSIAPAGTYKHVGNILSSAGVENHTNIAFIPMYKKQE